MLFDLDLLEVLAGFKTNGSPWRNTNLLTSAGISADTSLAGLYLEDTETAQFDAFTSFHRGSQCVKNRIDSDLGFHLGDGSLPGNFVDNVDFDHRLSNGPVTIINTVTYGCQAMKI